MGLQAIPARDSAMANPQKNTSFKNKNYIPKVGGREEMSGAAIPPFGKQPQPFLKRARVRLVRCVGTEAKAGAKMNVIKE